MNATPNFDAFFKQFTETLPKGLLNLHHDLEKNLRVGMESTFRKMNLVTREEFEIQYAVLEHTRTRLEALEVKVAALEAIQKPTLPDQPNQTE
ncbi:accessory factor UbiK family protein [Candidatus Parabeggiatoa sp. HSG14]|uniref:accessory factor UbiK family protein n=1 Tax=Candidatus Parabeggiatoa sp. HSG14 TaxID=3055593 RepID=UPI0025A8F6FA|nr:accessory factor UbiK family protein [Thiotrichales bacterium HSG14]